MNSAEILKQVERDWQTARPEIDPQPMVAVLAILRTAMAVQRKTEELFAEYGLNTATFGVLATLRRASEEGMTLSQLARFVLARLYPIQIGAIFGCAWIVDRLSNFFGCPAFNRYQEKSRENLTHQKHCQLQVSENG